MRLKHRHLLHGISGYMLSIAKWTSEKKVAPARNRTTIPVLLRLQLGRTTKYANTAPLMIEGKSNWVNPAVMVLSSSTNDRSQQ
jgi:hypothetical protein